MDADCADIYIYIQMHTVTTSLIPAHAHSLYIYHFNISIYAWRYVSYISTYTQARLSGAFWVLGHAAGSLQSPLLSMVAEL